MSLSPGQRLGPYEIIAPLGAGGMGEVYRARDTKLDREVAVKVLPARLAEDAEALARFEREAKAVAALSHPNILAIHDFGREAGTAYAVMELLEGETLRERLAAGALPVRKAVEYAVQIAQGLAAAHDKGIVHRDLKPENVFVTRDGRLKILDFGLAKRDAAAGDGSETSSPTAARPTEPGAVLGTVGYMSPEQVRGQPADARSDIFSLGTVLYEMLSGRRAFARETSGGDDDGDPARGAARSRHGGRGAAAVARPDRPALPREAARGALPVGARPGLRPLEPQRQPGPARAGRGDGPEAAPGPRSRSTAALVALGTLVGLVAGRLSKGTGAPPAARATTSSFVQLTDQPGVEKEPAVSPDGKSVVYAAESGEGLDLFFLRVGGRNPQNLTADSAADDYQPAFSPDGETIAFRSERDGGRHLRHGLDRRVGEAADRLRLQPGLVPRRPRDRGGLGGLRLPHQPGERQRRDLGGRRRDRQAPRGDAAGRRLRRDAAGVVAERTAHRLLGPARERGAARPVDGGRGRLGGEGGRSRGDERRRPRLEPGLGPGRPPSLLLQHPRRHHEPLAGADRRGDGPRARRARAPHHPFALERQPRPHPRRASPRLRQPRLALDAPARRLRPGPRAARRAARTRPAEHPAHPRPRSLARRPVGDPHLGGGYRGRPGGAARREPVPSAHRRRLSRPWRLVAARRRGHRLLLRPRRQLRGLDDPPGRERARASRARGRRRITELPRVVAGRRPDSRLLRPGQLVAPAAGAGRPGGDGDAPAPGGAVLADVVVPGRPAHRRCRDGRGRDHPWRRVLRARRPTLRDRRPSRSASPGPSRAG